MSSGVEKFRIAIYGVLLVNGRALMTRTKVPSGSIINFPGGGLELGENPVEALRREYREETSLEVEIEKLLFCTESFQQNPDYQDEQLYHVFYQVKRTREDHEPKIASDDVLELLWMPAAEIADKVSKVDREFVNSIVFKSLR